MASQRSSLPFSGVGTRHSKKLAPSVFQLRQDAHLQTIESSGVDYQYIGLNLRDPVLRDVRVRQALAYAIDRQPIVDYLRRGLAEPAAGPLPPCPGPSPPMSSRSRTIRRAPGHCSMRQAIATPTATVRSPGFVLR